MKRIFVPTETGTDWQRLLGRPKLHWKKEHSAMSVAACWEHNHPQLPTEILKVLDSSGDAAITRLQLLIGIPEWEVKLPGGNAASQTDILAITRNELGLVILGVEAKVDESFGLTLGQKKSGATKAQLSRIAYLEQELECSAPLADYIRYQLLHRTVSALLTAREFFAPVAVMLVHSFSRASKWREDFEDFCKILQCTSLSKDIYEVTRIDGIRLILVWCKGDEKYLDVQLPSAC